MATRPKCFGYLDDHHQCVGLWKRRFWTPLNMSALTGCCIIACVAPMFLLTDDPSMPARAIGLVLGVVVSAGLRWILDHWPNRLAFENYLVRFCGICRTWSRRARTSARVEWTSILICGW
jgi:hypothetical protein